MEHWISDDGTVEPRWWNSRIMIVGQWNSDDGRMEQRWWNSGIEMVEE